MIKLIKYNESHFDKLLEIHEECFGDEAMSSGMFREELGLNCRIYFVALNNNEPVGYAGAWNTSDEYDIISAAVKPEFRRQGIARKLIERLIKDAREKNIFSVSLEVSEKNTAAINLYRDLGFIVTNVRENYYKNKVAAYIMWLHL